MKYRIIICLLGQITFTQLAVSAPDNVSSFSPDGDIDTYYSVSEGETLTFTRNMVLNGSTLEIEPVLGQIFLLGASMDYVIGTDSIESYFLWIPDYCHAGPEYTFDILYYADAVLVLTESIHITVYNVNRPPEVIGHDSTYYSKVGSLLSFSISSTDLDESDCGDDSVFLNFAIDTATSPPILQYQGNNQWTFDWSPITSDWGSHITTFFAVDEYGGADTSQAVIDVYFCGDANHNGSVTLADVIHMVNKIFNKPGDWTITPPVAGDVNGDTNLTLADVIYLVNHIFNKPGNWTPVCNSN